VGSPEATELGEALSHLVGAGHVHRRSPGHEVLLCRTVRQIKPKDTTADGHHRRWTPMKLPPGGCRQAKASVFEPAHIAPLCWLAGYRPGEWVASRTWGQASPDDEQEAVVSLADKFSNKAQELRGRIKRNTGEVIGDPGLRAEGRADERKSNLKQAGEKIKDAFRGRGTRRRR
jgi:uncharacterized protein YjbJ (UPF0337 family)